MSLDFHETSDEIAAQHYAFLIGEADFDAVFGRIREQDLPYWADPGGASRARSTHAAAAACTSRTPTATCSRSSPAPTAAAPRARSATWRREAAYGLQETLPPHPNHPFPGALLHGCRVGVASLE